MYGVCLIDEADLKSFERKSSLNTSIALRENKKAAEDTITTFFEKFYANNEEVSKNCRDDTVFL